MPSRFDAAPKDGERRDAELAATIFAGPGEMRRLCRAFDWTTTALGPLTSWPQSLRIVVRILLASRAPLFLFWGPELIQIYNDAYRVSFGESGRHPGALGMRGSECWAPEWDIVGPQLKGVMAGGASTWVEDQLVSYERNGRLEEVYWSYGYTPVTDDDGSIGGALAICTETTKRVLSAAEQERLVVSERHAREDAEAARDAMTRVFSQAPVAIAVLEGPELRYTVANPRYQHIIGDRDPVGSTLLEMFPELAGDAIVRVLHDVYDTGVPFVASDLLIRFDSRQTGQIENFYDLVYHPVKMQDEEVRAIVVVAVDVTERRRTFLERERLLGEAERARLDAELANRAKSEFLAVMSHELRTPLNAIGGYADLIEMGLHGPVTAEQRMALERIQRSRRHLLGLINGVLDYAKVSAGAVHYEIEDLSLNDILTTSEALIAPQALSKGLTLRQGSCVPILRLRADREKVQQIVLNLLSNAVKFTRPGGRIALNCMVPYKDVTGARVVAVRVVDDGLGIAADQIERVFQPFVQIDAKLTRTEGGTGLGLSISRDLARGMGGDLTCESTLGVGSIFTLTLPTS